MGSKAKKGNRIRVNLVCPDCKRKNYITTKNKMNTTDKLKLDKYCPWCRKNLTHNEGKVASGS